MPNAKAIVQGTLTYVHVDKPYAYIEGAPEKYSLSVLVDKTDEELVETIKEAIQKAAEQGKAQYGNKFKHPRLPLNDGDTEKPKDVLYRGKFYLNAKTNRPPQCVDGLLNRIPNTAIYSGCIANVSLNFYPYCVAGNCGVAVALGNIQFVDEGTRLDYILPPEQEFEKIPGAKALVTKATIDITEEVDEEEEEFEVPEYMV